MMRAVLLTGVLLCLTDSPGVAAAEAAAAPRLHSLKWISAAASAVARLRLAISRRADAEAEGFSEDSEAGGRWL